jgi:tetratricopeptide (TPR) repeat protein
MEVRRDANFNHLPSEKIKSNKRLVGWKAIGQFLECTARTAMRWEAERGMPVHRVPGDSRSLVWASPLELTEWLTTLRDAPDALTLPIEQKDEQAGLPPPVQSSRPRRRLFVVALVWLLLFAGGLSAWRGLATSPKKTDSLATSYDDDPAAREAYLMAQFEFNARTPASLLAAEKRFRQLVDRFPDRAVGWSGLADTYMLLREFGPMSDEDAFSRATRAARTALSLDPNLADAWLDQAFVAWWWHADAQVAFPAFKHALELDPASAKGWHWYANALEGHGDFAEALRAIARARALEPTSRSILADEAMIRFDSGDAQALATLEQLEKIDPAFESTHWFLSQVYGALGRDEDFLRESIAMADLRQQPDASAEFQLAAQRFREGGRQAMLKHLGDEETRRFMDGKGSAVLIAKYRAFAQDRNGMLKWLQIAEDRHETLLMAVRCNPIFAPYREDPDVHAMLARMR